MTFLPIVERELRVASRRLHTYVGRVTISLGAIGLFLYIYLIDSERMTQAELGQELFEGMTTVVALVSISFGFATADCLSVERREGTLGLLFLTDLTGFDIATGKLAAHVLHLLLLLLAAFPILSLPVLMGGVAGHDFWRVVLACLNAGFFSACAGLMVSAASRHTRKAFVVTIVLVGMFAIGFPFMERGMHTFLSEYPYPEAEELVSRYYSPLFPIGVVLNHRMARWDYWGSMSGVHLLGWLWLSMSCFMVRRARYDRTKTAAQTSREVRLKRWSLGDPAERKNYRTRMLSVNPVCWVEDRYRLQKTVLWGLLLGGLVLWMFGLSVDERYWPDEDSVIVTGLWLHYGLLVWISFQSVQRLFEDRASGALELLLATPLSAKEIVTGNRLALMRQFAWPLRVILVFDGLGAVAVILIRWSYGWVYMEDRVFWMLACVLGMMMLMINAWAISWVGPWLGISSRKIGQATLLAGGKVLLMHWLLFMGGILALAIVEKTMGWSYGWRAEGYVALGWWAAAGVGCSLFHGLRARKKLLRDFRETAARRFDGPSSQPKWWHAARLGEIIQRLSKKPV